MNEPKNRRARRALKAIQGGKPVGPGQIVAPVPDTPAQRFGNALNDFVAAYMKGHSGIDTMDVTKVTMQYSASVAIDCGAREEEYLRACEDVFDEEKAARG